MARAEQRKAKVKEDGRGNQGDPECRVVSAECG